jgi:hypothetical protein
MHYLERSVQWIKTVFPLKWSVVQVPVNALEGIIRQKTEGTA